MQRGKLGGARKEATRLLKVLTVFLLVWPNLEAHQQIKVARSAIYMASLVINCGCCQAVTPIETGQ